jgi:hypothetical protein
VKVAYDHNVISLATEATEMADFEHTLCDLCGSRDVVIRMP